MHALDQAAILSRIRAHRRGGSRWGLICMTVIALIAAGGFTLLRHGAGFLPVDMVRDRLVAAIESATGGRANVVLASAHIKRTDAGPKLVLDGFALNDAAGKPVVGAPRAEIDFDLWTLMFGAGAMRRVELHDVEVRLTLDRDGKLAFSSTQGAETMTGATDWRALIGTLAGALAGQEPALSGLDQLALRNGRLVIDDPHHGGQVRYDDITIDLDATAEVGRRLSIAARGAVRDWSLVALRDPRTPDLLLIDVKGVSLADAAALLRLPVEARSGAPVAGRITIRLGDDGQARSVSADLRTQEGQVVIAGGAPEEVVVSDLALKATWAADTGAIAVERAGWRTDAVTIAFAGSARPAAEGEWDIDIASGQGTVRSVKSGRPPIAFDRLAVRANWLANGVIAMPSWSVAGEGFEFRGDARFANNIASEIEHINLLASADDVAVPLSFWPAPVAPEARAYVMRTLERGRIDRLDLKFRADAATREALRRNEAMPRDALLLDIAASSLTYIPLPDFPPLEIEAAQGRIDGRTLSVIAPSVAVETPAKSRVIATDARFTGDYAMFMVPSEIEFRAKGPAEPLFDLFETPLLARIVDLGGDLDVNKGTADLRVTLSFPLLHNLKTSEIGIALAGSVAGLSIDGAVPGETLTDVKASLSMERGQFLMKGDGRLATANAPVGLDVKRNADGTGEASLSLTLDDAARVRRGLPSAPQVTGPIPVKVVRAFGGVREKPARVEADLARAAINGLVPGWSKPAGRPGRVAFAYAPSKKASDIDLQDFVAESAGFLLRGSVTLGANNTLRSAHFQQARLSPGDDARLDWERSGNLTKLTIRGANLDARPLLKNIYDPGRDAPAESSDIDIDLKTAILTGYNSEAATNVELRASRRGGDLRQFQLSGRFGRSEVRGLLSRRGDSGPRLSLETGDSGAFMRFIDLYRRMIGGSLAMDIAISDARQEGRMTVRDFTLRNEPALRRAGMDAQQQPGAAADTANLSRPRAAALAAGDVQFQRLNADFVRSAGRIDIKDGVIWGQVLGVQFEGIIDAPRDRVEVTGTYVPAYALNNVFAQLPLVGLILGGGQHGGLFGVNFKVSGSFAAPAVMINPISALTPGVFRRFFEYSKQSVEGRAQYVPREPLQSAQ